MIIHFISRVFPVVLHELSHWRSLASRIRDPELRAQALASLKMKKFHALGGSVYALYPQTNLKSTVRFIVALQTISDYLDNLCDRVGIMDETAFAQLHLAMADAVNPSNSYSDYYRYYPFKHDQGYLQILIATCRQQIEKQPSYHLVQPVIQEYVKRYSELQSYKHLSPDLRERRLQEWAIQNLKPETKIQWWEYAAATGSTLGMFLLFAASSNPNLNPVNVDLIDQAYFPWITGLHILLDYYIDTGEDLEMGDYNFTFKYRNQSECRTRLEFFIKQSTRYCLILPNPSFHLTVIRGLLAMYLSDPKALNPVNQPTSLELVRCGGIKSIIYHRSCRLLRSLRII